MRASPYRLLILCWLALVGQLGAAPLQFEVGIKDGLVAESQSGRLFVAISRKPTPEPRNAIGSVGLDTPVTLARDVNDFGTRNPIVVDQSAYIYPLATLTELPAGDYFIQALLRSNPDLRARNAPGNLYSDVRKIHLDPKNGDTVKLELSHQVPAEELPPETPLVKFVKIQSVLLTKFYGRPIYLRAGIILPRDYEREPDRRYPLWIRIGGWGARYSSVQSLMEKKSEFHQTWLADGTPRMILLQLDGAGPLGDCYQVNSANNGPYGDAVVQELIPAAEKKFRAIAAPRARVLSGLSTGGWVSLALQIFYPDFFNGTWTYCPDPVDFRAFELVNIYEDDNAYTNKYGNERPSDRSVNGDVRLTMRREVGAENLLGTGNSWTMSGEQWCTWNATYGRRGADGRPSVLWDPQTGKIDHVVAEQWKKYDLRLVLENNWQTLEPKLQGKLHISVGDADNYFLNNAVYLLDDFLTHANPPYHGHITYGPGQGHGWRNLTTLQMMQEMDAAYGGSR